MDSHAPFPIQWIDNPTDLNQMVVELNQASQVGVDTESNSLYAYYEQVCLMQFSIPETDFVLDPLKLGDFVAVALAPFFSNPNIEKIFHASEYDLFVLKRDFGFAFQNIFDTMWAATILGWGELGLGSILQEEFEVKVDKRCQKANWGERPLPNHLLHYAGLDTHYLIPLRERLHNELIKSGKLELAQEDFTRFCSVNGESRNNYTDAIENDTMQIAMTHRLTQKQARVLEALLHYRDLIAQKRNRPPFRVLPQDFLLTIAQTCPTKENELKNLSGAHSYLVKQHTQGLLNAVLSGLKMNSSSQNNFLSYQHHSYDESFVNLVSALKDWRKKMAGKHGLKSDVVLPRPILEKIARQNPKSMEELHQAMVTSPWRYNHYGRSILEIIFDLNIKEENFANKI